MAFASTWRENETKGFRALAAFVVAGLLGLLVLVPIVMFLWPRGDDVFSPVRIPVGSVDDFKVGQPVYFKPNEDAQFWVVRLDDETLIALSASDPRNGCTLPWRPQYTFNNQQGWFLEPCHGSLYDITGKRVFGPTGWNMDRYEVQVNSGQVRVLVGEQHTTCVPSRTHCGTPFMQAPSASR
jgi:nitrite reductase/ring-hydroxylating ferredoxin subunit